MERIRTMIVDDERLSRKRMRRLLSLEPDVEVLAECASGDEALAFLQEQTAHLLFLDIQMPGLTGFEVLESLRPENRPLVVFVTAYDEHAVRAFEARALDYLLKPFGRQRLRESLDRVREQMRRSPSDKNELIAELLEELRAQRERPDRIVVRTSGKVTFVKPDEIDWIEAANNYVCIHVRRETHILRETMAAFEGRLDRRLFVRIHRSAIINVNRIQEMQPWFHGDYQVVLSDGTKLMVSRGYRDKLRELIGA